MKIKNQLLLLFIGLGFSCSQSLQENATISLRLTDDPAIYDAVWIEVVSAKIKYQNENENVGWVDLDNFIPGKYNILNYCNGKDTLLVSTEIAAGTISQINLILGNQNFVDIDGKSYDLQTPSASTSGLKLNVHEVFESGVEKQIWLDFNADKSIVETGNGKYQLKPVIKTYTTSSSGAIKGTVNPKEALPYVFIVNGTDTIGTSADPNGYFLIGGVPGGTYTVQFDPIDPYLNKSVDGVSLTNGTTTDLGEVLISQ
jgi:hypothetical protein